MTKDWINDAGHGGDDPGAMANGYVEKEFTLEAEFYVDRRLADLGISSHCTRHDDGGISREYRTDKCSQYNKGISHHFNAGGGEGAEFIHSIYTNGAFEKMLEEEFRAAGYPVRRSFTRTYPGNANLDYYYMNRETGDCRMTIVEYEFLDGDNADKLKSKAYREGMYECVVKAICRDEGVKYVPKEKPKQEAPDSGTYYRVVTGSFQDKENAEDRMKDLKDKGFDSFLDVYKL